MRDAYRHVYRTSKERFWAGRVLLLVRTVKVCTVTPEAQVGPALPAGGGDGLIWERRRWTEGRYDVVPYMYFRYGRAADAPAGPTSGLEIAVPVDFRRNSCGRVYPPPASASLRPHNF